MALTKTDLQAIRKLVREEVQTEVSDQLGPVKTSIEANHQAILKTQKEVKKNRKEIKFVRKALNGIIEELDKINDRFGNRLTKVETKLNLASA